LKNRNVPIFELSELIPTMQIETILPNNTLIKHKREDYTGLIDGITKIKEIFTGSRECEWQYRVRVKGEEVRRIAHPDDIELLKESRFVKPSVDFLYHFTDLRNIPSIRKHGLLSWKNIISRKIICFPSSSNQSREIDRRKNLHGYVRLCLRPWHRMADMAIKEERVKKLAWLKVNGNMINWRTTLFSDTNAASKTATINVNPETALDSADPQAEVLIEWSLSPKWIIFPK